MIFRKISDEIKVALARKNLRIQRLRARIMVLTEDLEIAEGEAGRAQTDADHWCGRWKSTMETATKVLERMEAAEAKLKEKDESERAAVRRMNEAEDWVHRESRGAKAAETKLKKIAKLVDSDYNNGMILDSYTLTANIRRILK